MSRHALWGALALLLLAGPVSAETEVLFDGSSARFWDTARDGARLEREFSLSRVEVAGDPAALRWQFTPRDAGFNDLFLMKPVTHDFTALRVRLRNDGAALDVAAKVRDTSGAEWTVPPQSLAAGGDWQWVEFPRDQWAPAGWSHDPDGKLDFPLASFTLIAFSIRNGTAYDLRVARVEAVRPDPPVATVSGLSLPGHLRAGERFDVRFSFTLDRACAEDGAALVLRRDGVDTLSLPLPLPRPLSSVPPGVPVQVDAPGLQVPLYTFGGTQRLALRLGPAHVRLGPGTELCPAEEVATMEIEQRQHGETVAEVRPHNGVPTLFINGQPSNEMTWATYGPTFEVFSDFTRAGVNLFTFAATPTESGYGLSSTVWKAPDEYDYSQLDERVQMLLRANPNACFFPRLYIHAPQWWSDQHPDDIVLMDPGDGKPVPFMHAGNKPAPSWASEAWRRDTVEGLRRLFAHIEASPYADRVIGYHIASGTTEEWMMWGGNEDEWVDYSPANTAHFRAWLQRKYGTDLALAAAWNDPGATLQTATVPTKATRQRSEFGALRDPLREQAVIDYYLYNSDLVAETIAYFAHATKELTGHKKIVGAFYGYLLQLCGEQRQQNAGHLALETLLQCPDLDFLTSPTSYAFRGLGSEGTSHFMSLAGSVREHGKLWFDENDIRTSLAGGQVGEWGRPADVDGDIIQQEKELANVLTNGVAQWWFDVGANRYDDPRLLDCVAHLTRVATKALDLDRSAADEVAMVVDERSLCYLRVADPLGAWLLVSQLPALHRIGAPVGHYLVTDLPRLGDRKLFLIMTSFAPTAADRAAVDALKRDGHVLVFLVAPGLYRDGQVDESAMRDFTGIDLKLARDGGALRVTLRDGDPLTAGLAGQAYGPGARTAPLAYADDPAATVLGTLDDGRAGLAVKPRDGWTAVYSAAPMLPTSLLSRLADRAGVHRYISTEDVVWASREMLAVCTGQAGAHTISLPRAADVTDLYTGAPVAQGVDSFEADFAKDQTRVFAIK
jgi:hypothetical protein